MGGSGQDMTIGWYFKTAVSIHGLASPTEFTRFVVAVGHLHLNAPPLILTPAAKLCPISFPFVVIRRRNRTSVSPSFFSYSFRSQAEGKWIRDGWYDRLERLIGDLRDQFCSVRLVCF